MKSFFFLFSLLITGTCTAQPALLHEAIISTSTNIIAPDDEEPSQGGRGGMFMNMFDGEIKFTVYVKNEKVKTVIKSDVIKAAIYRDNNEKMTTTVYEMMGAKQGFYVSDSEQVEIKRKMDSARQARRKADTTATAAPPAPEQPAEIVSTTETKKIAGYECRKVYIISTRLLDIKDTTTVWYTPEIKFQNLSFSGGLSAFSGIINTGGNTRGLDKLDGFVMRYESNLPRNRRMEVEVTKIDTKKAISDKEFDIPKDYEIKPMKDMQPIFGGRGMGGQRPGQ